MEKSSIISIMKYSYVSSVVKANTKHLQIILKSYLLQNCITNQYNIIRNRTTAVILPYQIIILCRRSTNTPKQLRSPNPSFYSKPSVYSSIHFCSKNINCGYLLKPSTNNLCFEHTKKKTLQLFLEAMFIAFGLLT